MINPLPRDWDILTRQPYQRRTGRTTAMARAIKSMDRNGIGDPIGRVVLVCASIDHAAYIRREHSVETVALGESHRLYGQQNTVYLFDHYAIERLLNIAVDNEQEAYKENKMLRDELEVFQGALASMTRSRDEARAKLIESKKRKKK